MTIDKNNQNQVLPTAPQSVDKDANKAQARNVVVRAEPEVQLVAQNIDSIKAVANNINKLIRNTTEFNNKYDQLNDNNIYQNNTLNALEVIDKGLDLKKDGSIANIANVADIKDNVRSVSAIKDEIQEVSKLKTLIESIANIVDSIRECDTISDQIVMNSAMHKEITEVINYHKELLLLHSELNKLLAIYEYLPDILKQVEISSKFITLQGKLQFTDEELYNILKNLNNNLNTLFKVEHSIDDITTLKETLEKAPHIVEKTNEDLNNAFLKYDSKLKDNFSELNNKLSKIANEADISIKQDLSKVHSYTLESKDLALKSKEAILDLDKLKYTTEIHMKELTNKTETYINDSFHKMNNIIKDYEIKYDVLKNETKNIQNEYEKFRENIDMYVKSQIVDLLKITLEPVFKENNMTIDGLDKLLSAELANPTGDLPSR